MGENGTKREQVLAAAVKVVRESGAAQLTLEAVASKAGVSKGGLLYHFPNKEILIQAMVDELMDGYVADIEERVAIDRHPHGKWSRAYVESTFQELEDGFNMSSGLLAALFMNPALLSKLREQYAIWQKKIGREESDSIRPVIARLAADGLWFAEIFGLAPPDEKLRSQVAKELISWTKEEGDR
ncbi:TetR/AcrR family transcriptional regulator [Planococcus lenghuensis]|uniref:TetR family transcriptional regulator n=1 Tax=Planococcus lenghuensis TaxID=2213202 RepID=A0A1Q2KW04_9BACL|nr:TetR/AcrR family transcriptional regulator [Planococcus lenghuensis]AQQ52398.1 TetR family transcriptional regulator [Planococcus lenghuensis]